MNFDSSRFAELATKVRQINDYSSRQLEESVLYENDRIAEEHRSRMLFSLVGMAGFAGAAIGSGVAMTGLVGATPLAIAGYAVYHAVQSMRDHSKQALVNLAKETAKAHPDQKLEASAGNFVSKMWEGLRGADLEQGVKELARVMRQSSRV